MTSPGQPPANRPSPPVNASDDRPFVRRHGPALILVAVFASAVLAAVVALELFVVRRIPLLTEDDLVAAQARWAENGPTSYDMDFVIEGVRPGTVQVEVRAGEVTAMQRDGKSPRQPRTWQYWSIPGRFDEIEIELDMATDPKHELPSAADTRLVLKCEFDERLGYPRQFHRIAYGDVPDVYWRVTRFEPR